MNLRMIVLTVLVTVSTIKAQDTIKIQSYRIIDVCSGTKRWLMSINLGTIRFADSLQSFDITIGYDRNVLRPTDVLKEGTLSGQMSYGPTLNTVVPNEMRVVGFNVARSVAGDIPLIAVSGDFIGPCDSVGRFTLPWVPDFNAEFKKRYSFEQFDSIQAVAIAKGDTTIGCRFEKSIDTVASDSILIRSKVLLIGSNPGGIERTVTLKFVSSIDTNLVSLQNFKGVNCSVVSTSTSKGSSNVKVSTVSTDSTNEVAVEFDVVRKNRKVEGLVSLIVSMEKSSVCECTKPALLDTITYVLEQPIVSVGPSVYDGSCTIDHSGNMIIGTGDDVQMNTLTLYDLQGRIVQQMTLSRQRIEMSTSDLPQGVYIAEISSGNCRTMKLISK